MIVSDLDGTLLGPDTSLSTITINALRRVPLTAASSSWRRPVAAGSRRSDLLRPAGAVSWALCSNGATRYDLVAERLILTGRFPHSRRPISSPTYDRSSR